MKPIGYFGVIYSSAGSPVPTLGENIIPSRRWEAWREGVEDYQYLYELNKAIESVKGQNPEMAEEAGKLLETQVDFVLTEPYDEGAVYQARKKLTEMLLKLENLKKAG
jgi:hypothetical protein